MEIMGDSFLEIKVMRRGVLITSCVFSFRALVECITHKMFIHESTARSRNSKSRAFTPLYHDRMIDHRSIDILSVVKLIDFSIDLSIYQVSSNLLVFLFFSALHARAFL